MDASKVSLEAIRAVRGRVERSIPECRAALEATDGDFESAVASLQTELERKRDRWARMLALCENATVDQQPSPLLPPPSAEVGHERVLADLAAMVRARSLWAGTPNAQGLAALRADYARSFARPLPGCLDAFLTQWDGLEIDASTVLWGIAVHDRDALGAYDEPECEDGLVIGELRDSGYLFLRGDEVRFYDYSDPPPVVLAPNFESFLRDALNADLDVLRVVERAREAHS